LEMFEFGTVMPNGEKPDRHASGCENLPFAPNAADPTALITPRSTPPKAFAHDHGWQQVSWLAGHGLDHLPRTRIVPVVSNGLWLAAYSCGGSCGMVRKTHRIPLISPCGHYHRQGWHPSLTRVNAAQGSEAIASLCEASGQHSDDAGSPSASDRRQANIDTRSRGHVHRASPLAKPDHEMAAGRGFKSGWLRAVRDACRHVGGEGPHKRR
jgi:hypothetical protein